MASSALPASFHFASEMNIALRSFNPVCSGSCAMTRLLVPLSIILLAFSVLGAAAVTKKDPVLKDLNTSHQSSASNLHASSSLMRETAFSSGESSSMASNSAVFANEASAKAPRIHQSSADSSNHLYVPLAHLIIFKTCYFMPLTRLICLDDARLTLKWTPLLPRPNNAYSSANPSPISTMFRLRFPFLKDQRENRLLQSIPTLSRSTWIRR